MGTTYALVNQTRRQKIDFRHVPASKKKELAGNPVAAAIIAWYLLEHAGDRISIVPEDGGEWFEDGSWRDMNDYEDCTDRTVEQLVAAGILRDEGIEWRDEDEPEVFERRLRNVWMDG